MAYILSLDTSTRVCSIAIHQDGDLIGSQLYHLQKSHSSLLPAIVDQLLENCELSLDQLDAIAISEGPGSYTGLRIGTSTAKGLAFTLGLPLIAVGSLDTMLEQVLSIYNLPAFFCPMIDARRMEVYCKLCDQHGKEIWQTAPLIVDENTFSDFTGEKLILFGDGAGKFQDLFITNNIVFLKDVYPNAAFMGRIAYEKYKQKAFVDLAYFEPEYLKEFHTIAPKQKIKL